MFGEQFKGTIIYFVIIIYRYCFYSLTISFSLLPFEVQARQYVACVQGTRLLLLLLLLISDLFLRCRRR